MSYALSFSPGFFWQAENGSDLSHTPTKRPTSVEQAVRQLAEETLTRLTREIFGFEPDTLTIEAVLGKIEETNTCLNLDSPVEVAIDRDAEFTVLVYDRDEES